MENIRLKKITVSPLETLIIHNGNVQLVNTNESSNVVSGAFISNGGISINSTYNSTSSSAGGALTVGGGVGIIKNLYVGQDFTLDNSNSVFKISGVSENRIFLDNIINKQFYVSVDGVNKRLELYDTYLKLNYTAPSTNSSTGSLFINGGISINCTTNALSVTNGGALTIAGGVAISKDLYIGGGITASNMILTDLKSTTISAGSLEISSNLDAFGNSNTVGSIFTTGGNVGIGTTSPLSNLEISSTSSNLTIYTNVTSGGTSSIELIRGSRTFGADTLNDYRITNSGGGLFIVNGVNSTISNLLLIDSNSTIFNRPIRILSSGGGILTGNQIGAALQINHTTLHPLGGTVANIDVNGLRIGGGTVGSSWIMSQNINQGLSVIYTNALTSGSTFFPRMTMTTSGNIGINMTAPAYTLDVNGTIDAITYTGGNMQLSGGITASGAVITSASGTNASFTNVSGSNVVITNVTGSNINFINITSNNAQLTNLSSTNICTGSINTDNLSGGNLNISNGITTGNIIVNGTFDCSNTSIFTGNTQSINSSIGTIVLTRGGLSINVSTNSISTTSGGALTVNGGVAIARDVYIGGNLNINGNVSTNNITSNNILSNNITSNNLTISAISSGSLELSSTLDAFGNSNTIGNIFTTGGNVGIGTTSPSANLEISTISTATLRLQSDRNDTMIDNGSLSAQIQLRHDGIGASNNGFNLSQYNYTGSSGFAIEEFVGGSNNPRLYITGGNIGINMTNPGFALDVNGTIKGTAYTGGSIQLSSSITSGGLLVRTGTTASVLITNNINIYSTTASNDVSSGGLVVSGGAGIGGNLNVGGNTVIQGNLTVNGSTVTVDSTNTTIKDNLLILNSGPSGTRDSGFIVQRYQIDNNTGSGDVVTDNRYISDTLPSQTGITSIQIKLSGAASSVDNYYNGWWIKVTSGFSINQVRKITGYVGSTKIATISSAWNTQNPAGGDNVYLYNKSYVGVIYNETDDNFVFGSSVEDPGQTSVTFTDNIPIKTFSATLTSTQGSTNSTTGTIVSYGGISINSTENASSVTRGGTLTSLGGGSFAKDLYIGGNLSVNGPIMKVPTGNTLGRPNAPQIGYIYYNTDTTEYEGYLGSTWVSLSANGQLSDLDGNTKIMAEAFSGSNDNNLIFFTNGVERMRINSAGNMGINTTSPGALLHLHGSTMLSSTVNSTGVGTGGNLTVLGGASFSKDVYVGGTITSSSDIRLKDNITELKTNNNEKITDKLNKLRTIKFNYKHDSEDKKQIGFIAQDFIEDFPELLRIPDPNGFYTLDYSKITVLLVESIKELQNEISDLKKELNDLKNK